MGFFRFRRSIKIAPGVRWNFGKKSTSFSFGPRGLKVTAGTRGVRTTVGIPGTGISYTEQSSTAHGHPPTEQVQAEKQKTSASPLGGAIAIILLLLIVGALLRGCS